jgi:hypothetical protein
LITKSYGDSTYAPLSNSYTTLSAVQSNANTFTSTQVINMSSGTATPFNIVANSGKTTGDVISLQNRYNTSYSGYLISGCLSGNYNAITINGDYGITWQPNSLYGFFIAPNITSGGTRWSATGDITQTGNLTVTGVITVSNTTESTSVTTGSVILSGGLGVAKTISALRLYIRNVTDPSGTVIGILNRVNSSYSNNYYTGCNAGSWNNTNLLTGDSGINWTQASGYGFMIAPFFTTSGGSSGTRWDSNGNVTNYGTTTLNNNLTVSNGGLITINGITSSTGTGLTIVNKTNSSLGNAYFNGCGTGANGWNNSNLVSGDGGVAYSRSTGLGYAITPFFASATSTGGSRWDIDGNLTNYGNVTNNGSTNMQLITSSAVSSIPAKNNSEIGLRLYNNMQSMNDVDFVCQSGSLTAGGFAFYTQKTSVNSTALNLAVINTSQFAINGNCNAFNCNALSSTFKNDVTFQGKIIQNNNQTNGLVTSLISTTTTLTFPLNSVIFIDGSTSFTITLPTIVNIGGGGEANGIRVLFKMIVSFSNVTIQAGSGNNIILKNSLALSSSTNLTSTKTSIEFVVYGINYYEV